MNEHEYLNQVKRIISKSEEETNKKALTFNIFHTLHANDKEVLMCRMLYEFLNPKGSHGRGKEYLRWFIENVLAFDDVTNDELDNAKIFRKYVIKNTDRRIDLYIDTPYRTIPIEVKIYAKDQGNQCLDYYVYAAKENDKKAVKRKWNLVYLTLYGDMPSVYSTGNDKNCINSIKNISWSEHILNWMQMIKQSQENNINVKEIVAQYIDAIKAFTNQKKGLVYKKMEESGLLDSRENMKAAQAISENFARKKTSFIQELFDEVGERVKKEVFPDGKSDEIALDPWDNKNLIHKFYQSQRSTLPALNYLMKEFSVQGEDGKYQIWLRFEIDSRPFVSFIIVKKYTEKNGGEQYTGEFNKTDEIYKMAESYISKEENEEYHRDGWWIDWFYVPSGGTEAEDPLPDFKLCNDAYFDLYEKDNYDAFVDSAVAEMKRMKERIKNFV